MTPEFRHEIDTNPEPEKAGTITVNVSIVGDVEDNLTFTTLVERFMEDHIDDCQSKQLLNNFMMDAGINDEDSYEAFISLMLYVSNIVNSSNSEYSRECALEVLIDLPFDDIHNGEAIQESFEEINNIRSRPASTFFVENLTRRIYNNIMSNDNQNCMICLEEFNEGEIVVTLPCEHEFEDECIVKWFETNHVCPLCRFQFPRED